MNNIKLAFFSGCYGRHPFGGPTIRHSNMVRVFNEMGIDVTVFTDNKNRHPDYDLYPNKTKSSFEFKHSDFNVFWVEQGFNYVTMLNKLGIKPIIGSNLVPCRAPQHCLPYLDDAGRARQPQYEINEREWVKKMEGKFWCSQSDFQEKEYRDLGLDYNIPVFRCNNPVDTNLFKPLEKSNEDRRFTVGWTGKNNWAKHPEFLRQIADALPTVQFKYFSDEIPNWGDTLNLKFVTGNTNKSMPMQLNSCDMHISTSVTENQPLGVLEAMACGLPVITFRTSGMPEIITHNTNGLMVDLGNIQHFVVEIKRILLNKARAELMGKAAREYIINHFSIEACKLQYEFILSTYLGVL